MKKRKLKDWVIWALIAIDTISLIVCGSDCEDIRLFIISHIVAAITFGISSYILLKNSSDE